MFTMGEHTHSRQLAIMSLSNIWALQTFIATFREGNILCGRVAAFIYAMLRMLNLWGRAFAFEAAGNYHFNTYLGSSFFHIHFSSSIHRWNCKSFYDGRAFAFEAVGSYHSIIFLGSSILHTHFSRGEYSLWLCNNIHRGNSKNAKVRKESIWVEAADNYYFFTSLGSSIFHRWNSKAEYNILCGCLASIDGILRMLRWESSCVWNISDFFPLHHIAAITPVPLIKHPRRYATLFTRSSHIECFRAFNHWMSFSFERVQEFNHWESISVFEQWNTLPFMTSHFSSISRRP